MLIFKCAESPEHVDAVKLTMDDINGAVEFFVHFKIPTFIPIDEFVKQCEAADFPTRHDLIHMLMDDLVKAYDAKHYAFECGMFDLMIPELRKKQQECRDGHKHAVA